MPGTVAHMSPQPVGGANPPVEAPLPAGAFSAWLRRTRAALRADTDTEVACGDCVGCCSSSYFIPIAPGETRTLERIPPALRIAAPGAAPGQVLMGYDARGQCPMLANGRCSIYAQRPQTCRTYDCRVFAAAGIAAGGSDKTTINLRVQRWQFSYPTELDRREHRAVQRTARFIRQNAQSFPGGRAPGNPSQVAILAIKTYAVLLDSGDVECKEHAPQNAHIAAALVAACRHFDAGSAPA
jgi:Fe-S-cluster containining protein